MKQRTATEKLRAVNEGKMAKGEFVRQMRLTYPQHITQFNGFKDSVQILKNRGLVFETSKEVKADKSYSYSDEAITRGLRYELQLLGHEDYQLDTPDEVVVRAKERAIKNLNKNPLHYINLISGESEKVDKHDKMTEFSEKAAKDTFNDLKKAELKEGLEEADPIPTEPGIPGERASNHDRKMAMRSCIDFLTVVGHPESGHKVSTQDALDFIKTHKDDIFNGDIDCNDINDVWHNYDEYETLNRDIPETVDEKLSDDDMKSIQNYGKEDIIRPYKIGSGWTKDFDYEGMLETGLKVRLNTPIETMQAIFDDFEDVNYHREGSHLSYAIDARKEGDKQEALDHLRNFKKEIKMTLMRMSEGEVYERSGEVEEVMGIDRKGNKKPDTDGSDASKYKRAAKGMKEDEEVVTERVGALDEFIALIEDRAAESGFSEAEEAEEVIEALKEHYNLNEKKGKDHDGDGDVDTDDYMAAKDKAIKKAMGKDEMVRENIKAIITKILEEEIISEAATANLADWGEGYNGFGGVKPVVNELENIVTEIEQFYDKIGDKIAKALEKSNEFENLDGMKVGAFIAPSLEAAFRKDLKPVMKKGFFSKVELPKVRTITQADIDAHNSGERPLGEAEPPKQTIYTPNFNESKTK